MAKQLTVREATRKLGISIDGTYRLLYADRFPGARKVGRKWAIPEASVEQRLKQRAAAEEAAV